MLGEDTLCLWFLNVHNLLSWLRKCPTGTCKSWNSGWENENYTEQDDIWICECGKMSEGQCVEWEKSREVKTKLCKECCIEKEQRWRESPGGEAEVGGWGSEGWQGYSLLLAWWDSRHEVILPKAICCLWPFVNLWESGMILAKDTGMVIVSNKLGKHRWTSMLTGTVD